MEVVICELKICGHTLITGLWSHLNSPTSWQFHYYAKNLGRITTHLITSVDSQKLLTKFDEKCLSCQHGNAVKAIFCSVSEQSPYFSMFPSYIWICTVEVKIFRKTCSSSEVYVLAASCCFPLLNCCVHFANVTNTHQALRVLTFMYFCQIYAFSCIDCKSWKVTPTSCYCSYLFFFIFIFYEIRS